MTEIIGFTELAKQGRMSVFEHFTTEEDINNLLARLKKTAEDDSERPSILAELKFITNMREFEEEAPFSYYEELAEQFCKEHLKDKQKKFIQILFENVQNQSYSKPKDYMKRIVDNLLSDDDKMEWKKDNLRLKILKQFIKYAGYFRYEKIIQDTSGAERKRTVSVVDGESYIKSYIKGKTGKKSVTDEDVLKFIDDDIFTYSAELKKTTDELKNQINDFEKTLNKLTANKKIIEEEMIQIETQKNKLEKGIENFNKKRDTDAEQIGSKIQTMEKRIVKAQENEKKQIETLSALSGNKGKISEKQLQEQILRVKAVRDNLKIEISESKTELETLRNSLIEAKAETEQKIKESEQKIKELSLKLVNLKEELEKLKKEIANEQNRIKKDVSRLKERIKSSRDKYALLQMAQDLAEGNFRSGGATKKNLYLLAMAFNMKYFPKNPQESNNSDSIIEAQARIYDIEKNLFVDFYNNNIMRFISDEYEEKANAFELDPSGQGINYKNFAEMIYIYYIYQNIPATEKIKKSNEMIERRKGHRPPHIQDSTAYYRKIFTYEIVNMQENEFEQFIKDNFDCAAQVPIQAQNSRNTAFDIYKNLIKDIGGEDYGLFFEDISMGKEKLSVKLRKSLKVKKNETEKLNQFVSVLCGMHRFIGKKSSKGIKLLNIEKKEAVTRTALIVAFYYHYNMLNYDEKKSFIDVFHDYTTEADDNSLNSLLKKAGYQPVSDKNIFDMAVIYSSYSYINE